MAERHFLATWSVDVKGLDDSLSPVTPMTAASCAFHLMNRPRRINDPDAANAFEITDKDTGERWLVDLGENTVSPLTDPATAANLAAAPDSVRRLIANAAAGVLLGLTPASPQRSLDVIADLIADRAVRALEANPSPRG